MFLEATWRSWTGLARLGREQHRLIWELARREWQDRSAGQLLGWVWIVGYPLLQMAIYLFIFQVVLKVRLGGDGMQADYAVYLLSGLIPWLAVQETLGKSSGIITSHANLVKQVIFPLEVLPVKTIVVVLLPQVISLTLLSLYVLTTRGGLPWTYALLAALVVVQAAGMVGIAFVLATLGTFVRDLKEVVTVACMVAVYLLPVFYVPEMVPAVLRPLLYLNPFSYLVWCYQDACYHGSIVHPWAWAVVGVGCAATLGTGYAMFQRLKLFFGQVL